MGVKAAMLSSAKVHPHFSTHFIALYQASILLYENGCSFIVHDKHKGDIVYARSAYQNEANSFWDEGFQLQALADLLESDEVCRFAFPQVNVLLANADFLLIPEALYDPDKVLTLFRYDQKKTQSANVYRNQFQGADSDLAFLVSENLSGLIHRFHPSAHYFHLVYGMLSGIYKQPAPIKRFNCLIFWEETRYFYFLLDEGRLIVADYQPFGNQQEAVYFIVNLYKHQLLSSEQTELQLFGENTNRKEIHGLLKQYLGDCRWQSYLIKDQEVVKDFELPASAYFYYSILRQCES